MSKTKKNKRLATINYEMEDSREWIEIDDRGVFFWVAEDNIVLRFMDMSTMASFPVGLSDVEDFFARAGRTLDVSKLPSNYVRNPYEAFL